MRPRAEDAIQDAAVRDGVEYAWGRWIDRNRDAVLGMIHKAACDVLADFAHKHRAEIVDAIADAAADRLAPVTHATAAAKAPPDPRAHALPPRARDRRPA